MRAITSPHACASSGCGSGSARFDPETDDLKVCDENRADGHGAMARYWRTDHPDQNNHAPGSGSARGSCYTHRMSMPAGTTITFQVCLRDGTDKIHSCGDKVTKKA